MLRLESCAALTVFAALQLVAGDDVLSQDMETEETMAEPPAGPIEPNEYEVRRQQNIERNRQMLASL